MLSCKYCDHQPEMMWFNSSYCVMCNVIYTNLPESKEYCIEFHQIINDKSATIHIYPNENIMTLVYYGKYFKYNNIPNITPVNVASKIKLLLTFQ